MENETENKSEKKYSGYGYHGGGRKKLETGRVRFQVSCQPSEEKLLREKAKKAGLSLSKFMVEVALKAEV